MTCIQNSSYIHTKKKNSEEQLEKPSFASFPFNSGE